MNIEVGEYIRTKNGRIGKLDEIYYAENGTRYYGEDLYKNYYSIKYNSNDEFGRYSDEEIVNHSKDIIDLIKVGDVIKTGVNKSFLHILATKKDLEHFKKVYKNDQDLIKSIVTKEQFSNMEYRV